MGKGPRKNKGLDFAEVVRQFLLDLTITEKSQFWSEFKALHPQKSPKDLTVINPPDITPRTEQLNGKDATAGA